QQWTLLYVIMMMESALPCRAEALTSDERFDTDPQGCRKWPEWGVGAAFEPGLWRTKTVGGLPHGARTCRAHAPTDRARSRGLASVGGRPATHLAESHPFLFRRGRSHAPHTHRTGPSQISSPSRGRGGACEHRRTPDRVAGRGQRPVSGLGRSAYPLRG